MPYPSPSSSMMKEEIRESTDSERPSDSWRAVILVSPRKFDFPVELLTGDQERIERIELPRVRDRNVFLDRYLALRRQAALWVDDFASWLGWRRE
jgi:hypothetical protein